MSKQVLLPENMKKYYGFAVEKSSSKFLMQKVAEEISKKIVFTKKRVVILIGPGNNGGVGIVLAKLLSERKFNVYVSYVEKVKSELAKYYKNILENEYKFNNFIDFKEIRDKDIIIDAMLGNLSRYKLENNIKETCKLVNQKNIEEVISIDIPTGLSSKNGIADIDAIKATRTIAIQEFKTGHFLNDAKDYVGNLEKVDISINSEKEDYFLLEDKDFNNFIKKRKNNTDKNDYKRVTIIGGSENFKGAPILSLLAVLSLKVGSGLAMVASIKEVTNNIINLFPDITTFTLKKKNKAIAFSKNTLDKIIEISSSIVIGPGITTKNTVKKTLKYLINNFTGYLIIDADAIKLYKEVKKEIKKEDIKSKIIITPHYREFSYLIDKDINLLKENTLDLLEKYSKENKNECILLKGPTTIVINNDEKYFIANGSPAQAKAGNGDVLSGVIASLVCNSNSTLAKTVAFSSYLCSLAANKLKEKEGENSVLASEIARYISIFNGYYS